MATALVSLLTNRPVRADLAMTGEITLRGQVLPVGGIKQKVLAAARVGLRTVILPERNKSDLDDLPEETRNAMTFVFAQSVDDVIGAALRDKAVQGGMQIEPQVGRQAKAETLDKADTNDGSF